MAMQSFGAEKKAAPVQGTTVHVALLAEDGTPIIHEELPAADATARHHMLTLQAELDAAGLNQDEGYQKKTRRVYMGDVWPPEGHEVKKGKVIAVALPEA